VLGGQGDAVSGGAALDGLTLQQPGAIVGDIARARGRASLRFRLVFALTWFVFIGGLALAILSTGKVHPDFLAEWSPFILAAVPVTIFVSVTSIAGATVLALVGALGRLSRVAPIYALATLYVSLVRGTPLIVQIIFVYLALPQFGIVLDPLQGGILALAFNYGAYMTEIFRAGIQAIPRGQIEAAQSLGMPDALIMRRIVLPQAVRIVIPAFGNEFIAMIKDSALVSYVGIQELFFRASTIGSQYFRTFETLMIAAVVYWVMTIAFSLVQERLEQRMARSDRRL
jgi:polar amino acid transport system permease protein